MALIFDENMIRKEIEAGKSMEDILNAFQNTVEQVQTNMKDEKEYDEKVLDECCQKIADATNVAIKVLLKDAPDYVQKAISDGGAIATAELVKKELISTFRAFKPLFTMLLPKKIRSCVAPVGTEDCKNATKTDEIILRDFFNKLS